MKLGFGCANKLPDTQTAPTLSCLIIDCVTGDVLKPKDRQNWKKKLLDHVFESR